MNTTETPAPKEPEEISLIDLFVVLLRYRRLVIAITLCGIIAAGLFYVLQTRRAGRGAGVEPSFFFEEAQGGVFEGRVTLAFNPRAFPGASFPVLSWFGSPALVYESMGQSGYTELDLDLLKIGKAEFRRKISLIDDAEKEEALYIINRRFLQNQNLDGAAMKNDDLVFKIVAGDNSMDILFRCNYGTLEQIESFLAQLVSNAEVVAREYFSPYARDMISWYESPVDRDNNASDWGRYQWAKDLLAGKDTVFRILYPPVAGSLKKSIEPVFGSGSGGKSPAMIPLVIVFASLFFAVFVAFCLNALKNISADNEAMAKIRGALGRDKKD